MALHVKKEGSKMENVVITISRQYGSGGKTIAAMLAQKLGVNFYSRDIF